jgi:hypothetical protein
MKFVPKAITRSVATSVLKAKYNSPQIFFVGGVIGVVTAAALACRATLKVTDVVDELQHDIDQVKGMGEGVGSEYDSSNYNKDLVYVYAKGSYSIAKLYGPAIVVGAVSIGALTGSHVTLMRRNAGLTAAFTLASAAYNDYRERVKIEVGPERELDIYHNATNEIVELPDGTKQIVKVVDVPNYSVHAKVFDAGSQYWEKNAELNKLFVHCQQTYANNVLQAKGHFFLNEAYDMFGLERSEAGQVLGWMLNNGGDNYIDFGLFEAHNKHFINGEERSIILDFNVDGVIYDKFNKKG